MRFENDSKTLISRRKERTGSRKRKVYLVVGNMDVAGCVPKSNACRIDKSPPAASSFAMTDQLNAETICAHDNPTHRRYPVGFPSHYAAHPARKRWRFTQ
jgi:hypothetical protein